MQINIKNFEKKFRLYPSVKLVYFFGSHASGTAGPLSDYDFAVYIDEKDPKKRGELKIDILNDLNKALQTDKIDVVVLNDTVMPELKYNIIKEGKLIFNEEPFKVLIEPKILNEYFDFKQTLLHHKLI